MVVDKKLLLTVLVGQYGVLLSSGVSGDGKKLFLQSCWWVISRSTSLVDRNSDIINGESRSKSFVVVCFCLF